MTPPLPPLVGPKPAPVGRWLGRFSGPPLALADWPASRLVGWAGLLLVTLLLLSALASGVLFRRVAMQIGMDRVERAAISIQEHATQTMNTLGSVLVSLNAELAHNGSLVQQAAMSQRLNWMVRSQPMLFELSVLGLDGRVLASSFEADLGVVVELPLLGPLPEPGAMAIGRPLPVHSLMPLSRTGGMPARPQGIEAVPLLMRSAPNEGPPRLLLALVRTEVFSTFQQLAVYSQEADAYLTTRAGEVVASPSWAGQHSGLKGAASLGHTPPFSRLVAGSQSVHYQGEGMSPGDERLVAMNASPQWPLLAVVEVPVAAINGRWWRVVEGQALVALVLAGLVLLATWAGRHRLLLREKRQAQAEAGHAAAAGEAERLQRLMETVQDLFYRADANGVLTHLNKRLPAFQGSNMPRSEGRRVVDLVLPAYRQAALDLFAHEGPTTVRLAELAVNGPYGEARWLEATAVPVLAEGRIVGFTGSVADVTERRKALGSLSAKLAFVHQVVQQFPLPAFLIDAERRYLEVNAAWTQFVGRSREETLGRPGTAFLSAEDVALHHGHNNQLLARGGSVQYRTDFHHAGGRSSRVQVVKSLVRDKDGQVLGILGVYILLDSLGGVARGPQQTEPVVD